MKESEACKESNTKIGLGWRLEETAEIKEQQTAIAEIIINRRSKEFEARRACQVGSHLDLFLFSFEKSANNMIPVSG